jgi:flagellar protein FliS
MYTSVNMRSANAYRTVGVETAVAGADPHQLVGLLYQALMQALGTAKLSIQTGDIPGKGKAISRAVRLIEEGLKAGLNDAKGGQLAVNLRGLYDYCIVVLSEANLRNDASKVDEVIRLMQPVAQAWTDIKAEVANLPQYAMHAGV